MNITELARRAAEAPTDTRYLGELDCPVASRFSTAMLREIDAVARYMSISRSDAIRALVADSLPRIYDLCVSQGPNAAGRTIEDLRPRYVEDLEPGEQRAYQIYQDQKTDSALSELQELD